MKGVMDLLRTAKCPHCDGSGYIPHRFSGFVGQGDNCSWCIRRAQLLSSSEQPDDDELREAYLAGRAYEREIVLRGSDRKRDAIKREAE